ncbi:malonyl CoA-acyl carrier protein transacylase, partial [Histoplasma capsulatum]
MGWNHQRTPSRPSSRRVDAHPLSQGTQQLRDSTHCIAATLTDEISNSQGVVTKLSSWLWTGVERFRRGRTLVIIIWYGHGVQRVGMTSAWLDAFPSTAKPFLEEMDSTLNVRLSTIISHGPNSNLNKTENSQPAIMATSILILRVLQEHFGFDTRARIDVTLGHSLGEYAALVAGGYLGFGPALKMVRRRAEIMAQCTADAGKLSGETYGMVALVCEPDRLADLITTIQEFLDHSSQRSTDDISDELSPIQQVSIANINSKNQIVLSGSIERIKYLLIQLPR